MVSLYNLFSNSKESFNEFGEAYPDICGVKIDRFKLTEQPFSRTLSKVEIDRFDLLISYYYGTCDYTDIVLWLNGKAHKNEFLPGDKIVLPVKKDIANFYLLNRR